MRMTEEQYQAFLAKHPRLHPPRMLEQYDEAQAAKKRPKYGNRKVTDCDGNVHDSGLEYRNWCELQLREKAGEISQLRRQVPYALVVNGVLVCQYIADAVYVEGAATIVEDTKSAPTRAKPEYRIKLKLMQAIHGIQIREVMA